MSVRDRIAIGAVLAAGVLAGYWFGLLAPKLHVEQNLSARVSQQKRARDTARAQVSAGSTAQGGYTNDYADVVRLSKAVPVDDQVPSLVYQLDQASTQAGVSFRSIKLAASAPGTPTTPPAGGSAAAPTTGQAGATPPSGKPPAAAQPGSPSTGGAPPAGGAAPAPSPGAPASPSTPAATRSAASPAAGTGRQTAATPPATAPAAGAPSAPATEASAATLPPGANLGPAGLATMPFTFTFDGSFFHLSDFVRRLEAFVSSNSGQIQVSGRLLTINGISLAESSAGFPQMRATISATAYLLPPGQGLLDGATPQGPANRPPTTAVAGGPAPTTPAPAAVTAPKP